jgi:serine protease Do
MRHGSAIVPALALILLFSRLAYAGAEPDPIAAMLARVSPAVVRVTTVRPEMQEANGSSGKVATAATTAGTYTSFGSGYIIDPSGYIGTNKHVVDGGIAVFVKTADGVRYPAKIVGVTEDADMALLKIDAGHPLPFVKFGDIDKVHIGDKVVAIGSPFGFDNTVTAGIVSALHRDIMESPFDDYIQTDAAINHGNSGGPLFNMEGEVIGMTSVIFSPDPASAGIGFAIPSSSLQFVFERLMKTGKINGGMLPIHTQQMTWMLQQALGDPDRLGALVTSVQDQNGTMLQGKIKAGDVIRKFNGEIVLDPRDLARKAVKTPIGSDAALEICRGGVIQNVHVTMQALPEAKPIVLDDDGPRALGLKLDSARNNDGGQVVKVDAVEPDGTAADSGIQKGDVIVEVQETPVSEPDQALRIFRAQTSLQHHFAAVLVEHQKQLHWMSIAIPD